VSGHNPNVLISGRAEQSFSGSHDLHCFESIAHEVVTAVDSQLDGGGCAVENPGGFAQCETLDFRKVDRVTIVLGQPIKYTRQFVAQIFSRPVIGCPMFWESAVLAQVLESAFLAPAFIEKRAPGNRQQPRDESFPGDVTASGSVHFCEGRLQQVFSS